MNKHVRMIWVDWIYLAVIIGLFIGAGYIFCQHRGLEDTGVALAVLSFGFAIFSIAAAVILHWLSEINSRVQESKMKDTLKNIQDRLPPLKKGD